MTEEIKEKLRAAGREDLILIEEINLSGYAGMNRLGHIVDRRFYPDAIPVQKNTLLNVPEPKPILVLSLRQPWASLIFERINEHFFAKMWETRGWKTKYRGCLHIHSSQKFYPEDQALAMGYPFLKYFKFDDVPLGKIIGFVDLTKIMHTEDWREKYHPFEVNTPEVHTEEVLFGDYTDGRFAWKLKHPQLIKSEIKCNGALSIWEYDYETNGPKKKKK